MTLYRKHTRALTFENCALADIKPKKTVHSTGRREALAVGRVDQAPVVGDGAVCLGFRFRV